MARVYIGVGHGGEDPGAVANGLREADVNLVTGLAMQNELIRHGVATAISRNVDMTESIASKVAECNAFNADLAIEIHYNAGGGDGFEVYCQTNRYKNESVAFGRLLEQETKQIGQNSRGLKTKLTAAGADWFGFLREINCPAVLAEGAFLDNAKDVQIIDTIEKQRTFGVAYAKAALAHLGIEWKPEKELVKGKSIQFGFYKSTEYAQAHLKELEQKGIKAILVDAERYI